MYINKRGVAVAVVAAALVVGGAYYARGPSYLSNPVVTAHVTSCRGKGADMFCLGRWPAGHGASHHGAIEGATRRGAVKVRPKDDSSATTTLHLSTTGWVVRELLAAILVAGGAAFGVLLYRRRHRYFRENPDDLPDLRPTDPDAGRRIIPPGPGTDQGPMG